MHAICRIVALLVAAASTAGPARADDYQIDPSHTAIIFSISHLGYSYTYGRFNTVQGDFTFDAQNPAASQFAITIDAASLDTNDAKRDEHLRGPDFLNVKQFPTITFQSTVIRATDNGMEVTGNLTIHGVRQQIVVPLKKVGEGPGPYGNYRIGFLLQTHLLRSKFGMTTMLPAIGDAVAITISFEGIKQN